MVYFLAISVVVLSLVGVWGYRTWRRRERPERMISLVVLLREAMLLDGAIVAQLAGRAWDADLGDGVSEGDDGFTVSAVGMHTVVQHGRQAYLVNCMPGPYVADPAETAESIVDLRTRRLFAEHTAWISCDALAVADDAGDDELRDHYRHIGLFLAELLNENGLLICEPDSGRLFPINADTPRSLASDDPLAALQATVSVPVIQMEPDDERMAQAERQARAEWPRLVAAFEAHESDNFSVKSPITVDDVTEFIWLDVTAIEGGQVYGTLANEPANLGPLRLGSKVKVPVEELNDWCYIDAQGEVQGGFTIAIVQAASRRQQARQNA